MPIQRITNTAFFRYFTSSLIENEMKRNYTVVFFLLASLFANAEMIKWFFCLSMEKKLFDYKDQWIEETKIPFQKQLQRDFSLCMCISVRFH